MAYLSPATTSITVFSDPSSKTISPRSDTFESTWSISDTFESSSPSIAEPSNVPDTSSAATKKRGRKGHNKSRRGCLNCKKARVKCKEDHPACEYCRQRGFDCKWPELQIRAAEVGSKGAVIRRPTQQPEFLSISQIIQPNVPVFTIQDFRLFNHFVQTAYPHHPIGNDSTWKHEIPCISSNYDYLLHSMLALSASDIAATQPNDPDLKSTALTHRVKAISSLNAAISSGITTFEQGNAMLATCYTLIFQSTLLADGLIEYMAFIRGTVAVAIQMGMKELKFLFHSMFDDENVKFLQPGLQAAPLIDADIVRSACRSLELVGTLEMGKPDKDMYGLLLTSARTLVTSSMDAYMELRKIYGLFAYYMTHEEFRQFTDPANDVGKMVMSHFVAMQLIMTPITKGEMGDRNCKTGTKMKGLTVHWLEPLHKDVPPWLLKYYEWPMWVEREVKKGDGRIVGE